MSTLAAGGGERGWRLGAEEAAGGQIVPLGEPHVPDVAHALLASGASVKQDDTLQMYIGHNEAFGGDDISPTVTSKWAKGSGGPAGSETGNLVAPAVGVDVYNGEVTGDVTHTLRGGHDQGTPRVIVGNLSEEDIAHTLTSSGSDGIGRGVPVVSVGGNEFTHSLTAEGHDAGEDGTGRGTPLVAYTPEVAASLTAGSHTPGVSAPGRRQEDEVNLVAYPIQDGVSSVKDQNGIGVGGPDDPAYTLDTTGHQAVAVDLLGALGQAVDDARLHFRKRKRASNPQDDETWEESDTTNTLNLVDVGDARTVEIVVDPSIGFSHTQGMDPQAEDEVTPTLRAGGGGMAVKPGTLPMSARVTTGETAATLMAQSGENRGGQEGQRILDRNVSAVRRLTPRECDRLQGFPPVLRPVSGDEETDGLIRVTLDLAGCHERGDGSYASWNHVHAAALVEVFGDLIEVTDWTVIPGTSDSARYKQLGNAVCVNVAEWIGHRAILHVTR